MTEADLVGLDRERRAGRDDVGEAPRLGVHVVGDGRNEPEDVRLGRLHDAARQQQIERDALAGHPREPRRRDGEAELHADTGKAGGAPGHADVARQRQLEAAAIGVAVHGGERGAGESGERREHGLVGVEERLHLLRRQLDLVAQVGARAERAAAAADDHRAQPASLELVEGLEQRRA